jgi:hypothetical protein
MRCALRGSLGTVRQASLFGGCGSTGREFVECKNRGPSQDKNEESQRSLERAREIGAAGEDPAAEKLKREPLGRLLQAREKSSQQT